MAAKRNKTMRLAAGRLTRWLYRALGAGLAIGIMELLARASGQPLLRVPFVTSIVLTLAVPDSEAAQPYAVIIGHLVSTAAGFGALWCFGSGEFSSAVGVGLAAMLMLATDAVHPPAGIDGFLVPLAALPPSWTISPVLLGATLLAVYARLWARGEVQLRHYLEGDG